jgi:O-antigen/teichoic acid export membrane protein
VNVGSERFYERVLYLVLLRFLGVARAVGGVLSPRGLASAGAAVFCAQVLLAISGIVVARVLGPHGKGLVVGTVAWWQLLVWVSLNSLNSAANVRTAQTPRCSPRVLGNGALYALAVGVPFSIIATVACLALGAPNLLPLAFLTLPLGIACEIATYVQLALGRTLQFNLARIGGPSVLLAGTLGLAAAGSLTAGRAVAAIVLGTAVSLMISVWGLPLRALSVDCRLLLEDLKLGVSIQFGSLLNVLNWRLDVVVMALVVSASDVGVYSVANNVFLPLTSLASASGTLLTSRLAAQGVTVTEAMAPARTQVRAYVIAALPTAILLCALSPVFVPLVFGGGFERSVRLVWILAAGYLARGIGIITAAAGTGARRPRVGNVIEAIAFCVTLILLPPLLYTYGVTGAAVASTAAYSAAAVISFRFLSNHHRLRASAPTSGAGEMGVA